MSLGPAEIIVVLIVALIVLGPEKLPDAARRATRLIGELKNLSANVQAQVDEVLAPPEDRAAKPTGNDRAPAAANPNIEGFRLVDGQSPETGKSDSAPSAP